MKLQTAYAFASQHKRVHANKKLCAFEHITSDGTRDPREEQGIKSRGCHPVSPCFLRQHRQQARGAPAASPRRSRPRTLGTAARREHAHATGQLNARWALRRTKGHVCPPHASRNSSVQSAHIKCLRDTCTISATLCDRVTRDWDLGTGSRDGLYACDALDRWHTCKAPRGTTQVCPRRGRSRSGSPRRVVVRAADRPRPRPCRRSSPA